MLIDAPLTLSNTIMHHKHLSHLMAKSMNELAHKSPLIFILCLILMAVTQVKIQEYNYKAHLKIRNREEYLYSF